MKLTNRQDVIDLLFRIDHLPLHLQEKAAPFVQSALEIELMEEAGAARDIALLKLHAAKESVVAVHAIMNRTLERAHDNHVQDEASGD